MNRCGAFHTSTQMLTKPTPSPLRAGPGRCSGIHTSLLFTAAMVVRCVVRSVACAVCCVCVGAGVSVPACRCRRVRVCRRVALCCQRAVGNECSLQHAEPPNLPPAIRSERRQPSGPRQGIGSQLCARTVGLSGGTRQIGQLGVRLLCVCASAFVVGVAVSQTNERTNERTNEQTNDERTNERMNECTVNEQFVNHRRRRHCPQRSAAHTHNYCTPRTSHLPPPTSPTPLTLTHSLTDKQTNETNEYISCYDTFHNTSQLPPC